MGDFYGIDRMCDILTRPYPPPPSEADLRRWAMVRRIDRAFWVCR